MEKIKKELLITIGEKRLGHSIRVMTEAKKLSKYYDVDEEKVAMAGLLHDCARYEDKAQLLKESEEFGIISDKLYTGNVNLLHAPLGAEVAKKKFNISDIDILNAIRYHTTGRENMSMLEKIVYIADYIEPKRDFEGIEYVRNICYEEKDLDKALISSIDNTIKFIIEKNLIIHVDTIKARNFLLYYK